MSLPRGICVLLLALLCVCSSLCQEERPIDHLLEIFDKNQDGVLSDVEFEELYNHLFGEQETSHEGHTHAHSVEARSISNKFMLRSVSMSSPGVYARSVQQETPDLHDVCHPVEELFLEYDIDKNGVLDEPEIYNVSAALLLMVIEECSNTVETEEEEQSSAAAWAGGIVSAVIISLISLITIIFIPMERKMGQKSLNDNILLPLLAFAVGALVGDAVLHLIPAALGIHSHSSEGGEEDHMAYIGAACVVLAGVLVFFVIERQLGDFHHHHHNSPEKIVASKEGFDLKDLSVEENSPKSSQEGSTNGTALASTETVLGGECHHRNEIHHHDHHHHHEIKPVGYLSLFADGLHNFTDGLALGAAFSSSTSSGIATALAVFFHEVPQELGEFAILISSGLSKRRAVLWNFFSACTCILGVLIGLGIGEAIGDANKYIVAFIAGGFLYIALTDMTHELLHAKGLKQTLLQSFFVLLGFVIMFIIAYWLEEIEI